MCHAKTTRSSNRLGSRLLPVRKLTTFRSYRTGGNVGLVQLAALLAQWAMAEDLATEALIDLFPTYRVSAGDADSAAWIVYLSRDYVPARLRVLIDHLKQCTR